MQYSNMHMSVKWIACLPLPISNRALQNRYLYLEPSSPFPPYPFVLALVVGADTGEGDADKLSRQQRRRGSRQRHTQQTGKGAVGVAHEGGGRRLGELGPDDAHLLPLVLTPTPPPLLAFTTPSPPPHLPCTGKRCRRQWTPPHRAPHSPTVPHGCRRCRRAGPVPRAPSVGSSRTALGVASRCGSGGVPAPTVGATQTGGRVMMFGLAVGILEC
jgi:hypothetical protein